MKKLNLTFSILVFVTVFGILSEDLNNDPAFPTPSILRSNVAFWIKIYTEVSIKEGVLHDRDYPLIIYDRIRSDDGDSRTVRERRKRIAEALSAIVSSPESTWTDLERNIVSLYKKEADLSAISGAQERIRYQQGQKERFREGLIRSGMYLDTIRTILKTYNIPLRIAYLPHVESSFNTEAYSRVGAAGLWQFMRGTGKLYGMRIDYIIDERRDPVISTIAAAKYLSSSYAELGTWPLAITSYNHGVAGIKKAVAEVGSRDIADLIRNYKSRSFGFASSNFYSCFLAASHIADNHQDYFPDVKLSTPLRYNDFVINHYISAEDFCRYLNLPLQQFIALNPAVRPAVFSKHQRLPKGYRVHIPVEIPITELAASYNAIPDSVKTSFPPRPLYYRVNKGDNLYTIASRLGVGVEELAIENNITRLNRIRAGQILQVPSKAVATTAMAKATEAPTGAAEKPVPDGKSAETVKPPPETTESAAAEIAQAEEKAALAPEEAAMVDSFQKEAEKRRLRPVASGKEKPSAGEAKPVQPILNDSLREIAFAPAIVEPVKKESERPRIASNFDVSVYALDAVVSADGTNAKITVSVDETIGHYADWLGIPTWRIRRLNDMGRASNIKINRTLLIPLDRPDALERFATARLQYHMAIEEDFYMQYTVADVSSHTIKRGETLWDICNNNENPIPLWLFSKYNRHLDLSNLALGAEVWIPRVRERTGEEIGEGVPALDALYEKPPLQPFRHKPQELKLTP